ncbi:MAG TPA: ATP-binding cassette domain-containing protein [Rhabdochlamydiaceae bacterium]|nr:ATP-binding cassette domain-containing protein [Rhabdochlamydiaceae bacterium]
MKYAVFTQDLKKRFATKKGPYEAVRGVNLAVSAGEIFGFLGPNGAGKTTTLKMLTTLLLPDSGEAFVSDFDVIQNPQEVRKRIGYVSQIGGADREAKGIENLILQGQLYGMSASLASKRAEEVIDILNLGDCADRFITTYSGGQRRRLDIGLGIMHRPMVLFLDEPTTGLDPQNRANLWEQIRLLKEQGTTVFLTSHYLDEVDFLSDRLAIMDQGRIVAEGSPRELKKQIAGDVVTIGFKGDEKQSLRAMEMFKLRSFVREATHENQSMRLYVEDGAAAVPQILRLLDEERIHLQTIELSVPTLDDVFLKRTGRSLREN